MWKTDTIFFSNLPGLSFALSVGPRLLFPSKGYHLPTQIIFLYIAATVSSLSLTPIIPHSPEEPSDTVTLGGIDKRETAEGTFSL